VPSISVVGHGLAENRDQRRIFSCRGNLCADSILGGNRAATFYLALPIITDHPDTFQTDKLVKPCGGIRPFGSTTGIDGESNETY
jgi:hypothetical protein